MEEVAINSIIELPEVTQDWETDSGRAQQHPVHQDPGKMSSDPTGDCPRLACGCPGVSDVGMGWWWPAAGLGARTVAVHSWDPLREVTINPTTELPEYTQDWEIVSLRAQQNLMHQDPGEGNSDPTGDLPVGVQESPVKAWVGGGLLQGWGHGL